SSGPATPTATRCGPRKPTTSGAGKPRTRPAQRPNKQHLAVKDTPFRLWRPPGPDHTLTEAHCPCHLAPRGAMETSQQRTEEIVPQMTDETRLVTLPLPDAQDLDERAADTPAPRGDFQTH